ncbi:VOC family protein [Pseudomonas sp. EggHat1]|uniref:bleomycin resistance protein n=1 Tax=Pseudomonas sp. EggHat1 TaxID=2761624 RepID=UPI00299F6753|nr:VOC family protein [Pseudomonas sp. EggHat1]
MSRTRLPALTPELQVSDLQASLAFYQQVLGFNLLYQRPEDGFAAIVLGEAALMLEQIAPHARPDDPWTVQPLDRPLGRGINLQIDVIDLQPLYQALLANDVPLRLPLETVDYRTGDSWIRVRQLMIQDPDGYLLRFSQVLDR